MADFNTQDAQIFQDRVIERVRAMERVLGNEVVNYYKNSRIDSAQEAYKNFRDVHTYLRQVYRGLDQLMTDIERRPEYN